MRRRHTAAVAALLVLGGLAQGPSASALGTSLEPGESLSGTSTITSANGQFTLGVDVSEPGEVVVNSLSCEAEWLAATPGDAPVTLTMQGDGNLVAAAAGKVFWHTGTYDRPGARAVLQDNGELAVLDSAGRTLWHSGTVCSQMFGPDEGNISHGDSELRPGWFLGSPDGRSRLVLQTDGNLVLYTDGKARWSSGTNGRGATRAVLQDDGNLVLYTAANKAVWQSATVHRDGKKWLTVQNDGNVVLYLSTDPPKPLWSSGTHR